jgi:sugar phosphate permease
MKMSIKRKVLLYRWLIFSVLAVAYFGAFFHRVCPSVVALDIQKDFGISAGLVGLLASAYFYSYAFIQFPAGLLSDSLGPRAAVSLFLLVGGVGSLLFGLAPDMPVAVLGRVMVGLGAGMIFAPTMKVVTQWFRTIEFARVNSIFLSVGGLGALFAAEPLAVLTGWIGWRVSFELIGVGTLLFTLSVWFLVRNRPQDLGWPSLAEIDPVYGKSLPPPQKIPLWEGARRVITEKYFWPVAIWNCLSMGCYFAFGGLWAGPYLVHVYGMSRAEAGGVLNMFAVGIVLGSPILAYASDRLLHTRKWMLTLGAVGLTVVLAVLLAFPVGLSRLTLHLLFFCFAAFALAPGVISITTTKELFPIEITGTSIGTMNLFPFLGGAVMQLLVGWMLDAYPKSEAGVYALDAYRAMLWVLMCAALVALAATLLIKETFPGLRKRA